MESICKKCGKKFNHWPSTKRVYCSKKCSPHVFRKGHKINEGRKLSEEHKRKIVGRGSNHPHWKGGKIISVDGYIMIHKPDHPHAIHGRYVLEHRLVMETHLGRYLTKKEIVHHDGTKYPIESIENRQDNRIENLRLFKNRSDHFKHHAYLRKLKIS